MCSNWLSIIQTNKTPLVKSRRKEITTQHRMSSKHLEDAVKELVNKNAAENAIKALLENKISPDIGLATQMDDIKRLVGKFLPDEVQLEGKMMTDQSM